MIFKIIFIFFYLSVKQISSEVSFITLNSGHKMPLIGVGTCHGINKFEALHYVNNAVEVGFRHIDTGYICNNEIEVGLALEEKIITGKLNREDLFVTTKLWNTFHSMTRAKDAVQMALTKLGLKYIDLMLIHWPFGFSEGMDDFPKNSRSEIIFSDIDYLETWSALEEVVKEGQVKSIGVANFNSQQMERLISHSTIKPAINQIESHPHLIQKDLIDLCHKNGINITAYYPFGEPILLNDLTLKKIADKHKKSVDQVMIRYQIERGVSVIPDITDKDLFRQFLDVFDFNLDAEELKQINNMNMDSRINKNSEAKNHKYYPFNIPY